MSPDNQDDGALAAMDQIGQWVRYADAKAGLVAAAAAAVLALAAGNAADIVETWDRGGGWRVAITTLVVGAAVAGVVTFWALAQALAPRPLGGPPKPNRFSWPSLSALTSDELAAHVTATSVHDDAWQQARVLASIAEAKFRWCRTALVASIFMGALSLVVTAVGAVGVPNP